MYVILQKDVNMAQIIRAFDNKNQSMVDGGNGVLEFE